MPTVFEDLDNVSRPKGIGFDIGCYEYSSVSSVNENELPDDFILYQNYPNPFNPATRIKYQVASISQVSLKIYDVLGNVVATLVDEEKFPGIYEVEFDGTGLSSSVYIYQLITQNYIQTRKMLLIK